MILRRVALAVIVVMSLGMWWMMASSLTAGVDRYLEDHAVALLENGDVKQFRDAHPTIRAELKEQGDGDLGLRTVDGERVLAIADGEGTVVELAQDLSEHRGRLAVYSGLIALLAVLAATLMAVVDRSSAWRLNRSMKRVAATGDLAPIREAPDQDLVKSFNAMLDSLQESRIRKSQLIAEVGHDLRNPLTAMRTNIELLLSLHRGSERRSLPPEEHRALENDVLAQLDELSGIIDDLVNLSREDDHDAERNVVCLAAIVESACERARRRRWDVSINVTTTPWAVRGDGSSLGRGVINLLDNAVKWSPAGGEVRVTLEAEDDRRAILTVADCGPGIAPEERERVFDRFYRAPEVRDTQGTGLGLPIVKQSIERIGGRVEIGESENGGALLTAVIPGRPGQADEG